MDRLPPVSPHEDRDGRSGSHPIAGAQSPGDLPIATASEDDQTVDVVREESGVEARPRLRPKKIRPRDEPAQAPIAGRVTGEQDEMRAALPLADAPDVFLHRLAMARQLRPIGSRAVRLA